MGATSQCEKCGVEFTPCKGAPGRFCSRTCLFKSMEYRVTFNCRGCGISVTKPRSAVRAGYCSKPCSSRQPRLGARKWSQRSATSYVGAAELYGKACRICGFDRLIEYAHIVPASKGGNTHPENILPLCPNHHKLFDRQLLNEEEKATLVGKF